MKIAALVILLPLLFVSEDGIAGIVFLAELAMMMTLQFIDERRRR